MDSDILDLYIKGFKILVTCIVIGVAALFFLIGRYTASNQHLDNNGKVTVSQNE